MILCAVMMVGVAVSNTNEINVISKGVKPVSLIKTTKIISETCVNGVLH